MRLPRLVLAGAILVVGLLAALPFHRPAAQPPAAKTTPPADSYLVRRHDSAPVAALHGPAAVVPDPNQAPRSAPRTDTAHTPMGGSGAERPDPKLAARGRTSSNDLATDGRRGERLRPLPDPSELPSGRESTDRSTPVPAGTRSGETPKPVAVPTTAARPQARPAPSTAEPLRHRVVDGDTLPRIAEQHLGDAQRYLEIYAANRDILQDPDVLPIGAVLRITPLPSPPTAVPGGGHSASHLPLAPVPPVGGGRAGG